MLTIFDTPPRRTAASRGNQFQPRHDQPIDRSVTDIDDQRDSPLDLLLLAMGVNVPDKGRRRLLNHLRVVHRDLVSIDVELPCEARRQARYDVTRCVDGHAKHELVYGCGVETTLQHRLNKHLVVKRVRVASVQRTSSATGIFQSSVITDYKCLTSFNLYSGFPTVGQPRNALLIQLENRCAQTRKRGRLEGEPIRKNIMHNFGDRVFGMAEAYVDAEAS
jgi:hypothetical protein